MTEFSLSGYELSVLRKGDLCLYRGHRTGSPPILLVTTDDDSVRSFKRLEHEFELKAHLNSAWAARPIALTQRNGSLALVFEDPGGEPLDRMLGGPFRVAD